MNIKNVPSLVLKHGLNEKHLLGLRLYRAELIAQKKELTQICLYKFFSLSSKEQYNQWKTWKVVDKFLNVSKELEFIKAIIREIKQQQKAPIISVILKIFSKKAGA